MQFKWQKKQVKHVQREVRSLYRKQFHVSYTHQFNPAQREVHNWPGRSSRPHRDNFKPIHKAVQVSKRKQFSHIQREVRSPYTRQFNIPYTQRFNPVKREVQNVQREVHNRPGRGSRPHKDNSSPYTMHFTFYQRAVQYYIQCSSSKIRESFRPILIAVQPYTQCS